ncbi:MAG: GNAT family N-acetyltransferase [Eubacterium sp.]|nr:GNAT family N-acetyltransferase [Eubacterium sp.]
MVSDIQKLEYSHQFDVITAIQVNHGKGYITEVAKAVIRFLFNDVNFNYRKIIAGCDSENIGSSKVMEKIGMKREAVLREHLKRKDGT